MEEPLIDKNTQIIYGEINKYDEVNTSENKHPFIFIVLIIKII